MVESNEVGRRLAALEKERLTARIALLEKELLRLNDVVQGLQARLGLATPAEHRAAGADRRWGPRLRANRVRVRLKQNGPQPVPFEGDIVDYTPTGLGLFVDRFLDVETLLTLDPAERADDTEAPPMVQARVCNQRPEGNGWRLGCQLLRRLSGIELKSLGLDHSMS
jgi:hypothetical protein